MKATFIGVPGEDHDAVTMYGQLFQKGKAATVESPLARRKLAGHPHFKVEAEASDNAEDAQIKREFTGSTEASLADVQARQEAEQQQAAEASRLATPPADPTALQPQQNLSTPEPTDAGDDVRAARNPNPAQDQGRRAAGSAKR